MRTITLILIALYFLSPIEAKADGGFFRSDQEKHFNVGLASTLITYTALRAAGETKEKALFLSVGFSLSLSLLKEVTDKKGDPSDFAAGASGATVGAVPLIIIDF